MVEPYNVLSGSQTDINRRLLHMIEDLQTATGTDTTEIDELQEVIGDSSSGLVKKVADVETAIGDEDTEGTILARIKALEDAA